MPRSWKYRNLCSFARRYGYRPRLGMYVTTFYFEKEEEIEPEMAKRSIQVSTQAGLICLKMHGYSLEEDEGGNLLPILRFDRAAAQELATALQNVVNSFTEQQ